MEDAVILIGIYILANIVSFVGTFANAIRNGEFNDDLGVDL